MADDQRPDHFVDAGPAAPPPDRRVRRSRAALFRATIKLVSERETTAIPLSEIANEADVTRQVVYAHFGDRDMLLVQAALDLLQREVIARRADDEPLGTTDRLLTARHIVQYHRFYRALMTGSTAFELSQALMRLLSPVSRRMLRERHGTSLSRRSLTDLTTYAIGGGIAVLTVWLRECEDPDAEELARRFSTFDFVFALSPQQV
ncbi:TetR/AcrR family transcriptional regulator [Streptomyces sp. 8L]|uniref:TetR/AcrR family transcriptional regulator n=1 Tax=Streptomyces sp. 8L TaxID=2877242 RepID=UPI001CD4682E|nr:TetR family transcriptional regulator [Streptomyces sp. 8L]MCA1223616.1 TetR family transcriptional regulator [Streptomyces sp. 8L]